METVGIARMLAQTAEAGHGSRCSAAGSNSTVADLPRRRLCRFYIAVIVNSDSGTPFRQFEGDAPGTTGDQRMLFAAALAAFVNMLLQSLLSRDFWTQAIAIYFWIIMALPFALYWSTSKQISRTGEESLDETAEAHVQTIQQEEREQLAKV